MLPQLRNVTSVELGCSSRGYSRAGSDTKIWYCAIVAGRQSQELNKMREVSSFDLFLFLVNFTWSLELFVVLCLLLFLHRTFCCNKDTHEPS